MGRPKYQPTPEHRNLVKLCSIAGITHEKIAAALGIDNKTLTNHYKIELDTALTEFVGMAAGVIAHHMKNKSLPAAIFTLKTRAGWREVNHHEITGQGGGPLIAVIRESDE